MKRGLLVLLAICAFATAMVPRNRRAVNPEEQQERLLAGVSTPASTTENIKMICAPQTPCGWSIYNPPSKYIEMNITNIYCICGPDTSCHVQEDDPKINAFVQRCQSES